ncbi:MAG: CHAT domain-containing protein, partial [Trichodesmium erythraeum GBRTRLIN201]|nr:CHAT domain-containing protein [Trichodesmium erythraeum GBRTRLIN201]
YQQALLVYTQTDFPIDWATTQNNLGSAYSQRIKGDQAQNIEAAIVAYQQALQVRTLEVYPIDHLQTTRNLGNLYFDNQNWQLAADNYKKAITAVELSRSWSKENDRRQEIIEESIDVYRKIVQAYVNSEQIEKALEYVEHSRSKRLVDIMASNDRYSQSKIPGEVEEPLKEHEAIQQQIHQFWEQQQQGKRRIEPKYLAVATRGRVATETRNKRITQLETQKQEVYKKIRSFDRVLAEGIQVAPLEFPKIQALIQEPITAILSFYIITDNTYLFVLRQDGVKIHIYSGLGEKELQNWIWEKWFESYLSSPEEWQQQMPEFLQDVSKKLKLEELCKSYLQDIEELILIPHLSLHFLPWNAMPVAESGENKYLGDRFRIRTLASCQILDFCTQREEIQGEVKQGIVEDTHNDLPCSSYEAQYIAQMYGVPEHQRLRGEAATIDSYILLLSQVQRLLSTHHSESRLDNCMESALVLADGRLTLGQLLSPAFRFPDLDEVFIDYCETNLGQVQISDDVLTLNTGFLCAGARGVISSLWSVDDLGTCLFSIFYHQLRQEGKNRSLALQLGQRQLRELTGKELKKKYKKELEKALGEKLEVTSKQLQEIEPRRDSYTKSSVEYQELEEEREKLVAIYERIFNTKNKYLKAACKKQHPFEHPAYWSGFICAGLS